MKTNHPLLSCLSVIAVAVACGESGSNDSHASTDGSGGSSSNGTGGGAGELGDGGDGSGGTSTDESCDGIEDGAKEKRTRFEAATVPFGSTCQKETQTRTCNGGVWSAFSGTFEAGTCTVEQPASCGDDTPHGSEASRIRYQTASVPYDETCVEETQTAPCANGELGAWSGSYTFETCSCVSRFRGTVFAPNGTMPLANAVVYLANEEPSPLSDTEPVGRCPTPLSGSPLATALTDAAGAFEMNVALPEGAQETKLVVEIGKWRRVVTVPLDGCGDYSIPVSLPKNRTEGHMPQFAATTGGGDTMECLLRRVGIDDTEFAAGPGDGIVHLYAGSNGSTKFIPQLHDGGAFPSATTLWSSRDALGSYDVVVLGCEAGTHPETKSQASLDAMKDYLNAGGRLLSSHYQSYWLTGSSQLAGHIAAGANTPVQPSTGTIELSFAKGAIFRDWALNVQASTLLGQIAIPSHTQDLATVGSGVRTWISLTTNNQTYPELVSFNTPFSAVPSAQVGRLFHTDLHVSGTAPAATFPTSCSTSAALTPQEQALAFALFDLSGCVLSDSETPSAPPLP